MEQTDCPFLKMPNINKTIADQYAVTWNKVSCTLNNGYAPNVYAFKFMALYVFFFFLLFSFFKFYTAPFIYFVRFSPVQSECSAVVAPLATQIQASQTS